jgi:hypothetical protein
MKKIIRLLSSFVIIVLLATTVYAATIIQLRRDSSSNWTAANPVLAQGEIGWETNTGKLKIGDGATAWSSLAYNYNGITPITGTGTQYYLPVWTAAGTQGALAATGSSGAPLISGGSSANPAWASYLFSGTAAATYTFPGSSKTLMANDGSNFTLGSQAIGDLIYASSTTAVSRIAAVAAGQPLLSAGTTTVPAYAGYYLSGTAAQTYTYPSTTATLARTDAGQTFTGVQTMTSPALTTPTVATSIAPATYGSATLGTASVPFSSLYLGNAASNNLLLTGTGATSAKTITFPNETGTVCTSGSVCSGYQASGSYQATLACTANYPVLGTGQCGSSAIGTGAYATIANYAPLTSPAFATDIHASSAGGATLGTAALPFSDIYIGNAATNNIRVTGTSAAARIAYLPDIAATGYIPLTTATGTTAGQIPMATTTAGKYTLSTPTYPSASGTSGKVLKADGTNVGYSTETYAAPSTSGNVMISDGTNWTSAALLDANIPFPTTTVSSGAITVSARRAYVVCTAACQLTIPAPVAGQQICARNAPGTTGAITLVNQSGMYYEKTDNSGYITVNHKYVSGGAATDQICILGYDSTHYITMSSTGTFTDTSP